MPSLAIFFLDAVRFQDVTQENMPFLAKLASEGTIAPLETLLAYEGLAATLFTGTYPSRHGIWTRYYSDPAGSPFRWLNPFAPFLETIRSSSSVSRMIRYEVMKVSGSMSGISYFPGVDEVPFQQLARMNLSLKHNPYEEGCFGSLPSLFDIFREEGISFNYVDHTVFDSDIRVFRKAVAQDDDRDVVVVRFVDLDTVSHKFGLDSAERSQTLKQTDTLVRDIVTRWRRRNPELIVMCFADHGMVSVYSQVNIQTLLRANGLLASRDFEMFLDSTMARFWGDDGVLMKIQTVLSRLSQGKVVSEADRARFHIPFSPSCGELIFLLEPGNAIFPNFFETRTLVRAMHGYDPETPGLETVLLVQSPEIGHSPELTRTKMVDVFPTVLKLLHLKVPSNCEGNSLLGG